MGREDAGGGGGPSVGTSSTPTDGATGDAERETVSSELSTNASADVGSGAPSGASIAREEDNQEEGKETDCPEPIKELEDSSSDKRQIPDADAAAKNGGAREEVASTSTSTRDTPDEREDTSRLTPFERLLRTQGIASSTTIYSAGTNKSSDASAEVLAEEETRSQEIGSSLDTPTTAPDRVNTRMPPDEAKAKEKALRDKLRAASSFGMVSTENEATPTTETTTTTRILASDAEAKERARAQPVGTEGEPRVGAISVDTRTSSQQDACRTSAEDVMHGVQPLPLAANTGTFQVATSTTNENNNGATLEEVMADIQLMPSQPSLATPAASQPSHPGAHAVGQPGAIPVAMQRIRYSLFGRLSDNEETAQLSSPIHSTRTSELGSRRLDPRLSSSDLVVADMVNGSSKLMYQQAQVMEEPGKEEEERKQNRRVGFTCCALLCLVFISASIVFAVLFRNKNTSNSSVADTSHAPTMAPILPVNEIILDWLPMYTRMAIERHPESPQNKGYEWLLKDPNLASYPTWRVRQRLALAILYYSTKGDTKWWTNTSWLSYEVHECEWFASTISSEWLEQLKEDHADVILFEQPLHYDACGELREEHNSTGRRPQAARRGEYTNLRLFKNNLHGSLPPELYWLTGLFSMHFFTSHFSGTISSLVGNLQKLRIFDMVRTEATGSLPSEIGLLTNLMALAVHTNDLTGKIPSEIGLMENLVGIYLEENDLSSTVPTEIGMMQNLSFIYMDSNNLEGPLPSELGNLEKLTDLQIYFNDLTGSIPPQIGKLSDLAYLNVSHNYLTGEIPPELWSIENLVWLSLGMNNLQGPLHEDIGNLTNLRELDLGVNDLTGSLPHTLYRLEKLQYLYLHSNNLTGTLSSSIGFLTNLVELNLHTNSLIGNIPSHIGSLSALEEVDLSTNFFSGQVPSEVGQLSNLTFFRADSNFLTGSIPSELSMLLGMKLLNISYNDLAGSIPVGLGSLPESGSLLYLNVSSNPQLYGIMPPGLCGAVPYESEHYWECSEVPCGYYMECSESLCGCDCECQLADTTNSTNEIP